MVGQGGLRDGLRELLQRNILNTGKPRQFRIVLCHIRGDLYAQAAGPRADAGV